MSLIYETVATAGNTTLSIRLQKAVQHLDLVRLAPLSVLIAGLLAGLPESVSAEITHPTRDRVRPADRVQLSHIAYWAQHMRGPIVELAPATVRGNTDSTGNVLGGGGANQAGAVVGPVTDGGASVAGEQLYKLRVRYYLNDKGAISVQADDHFTVEISDLVVGGRYQVYAPEMPVLPGVSNMYTKFEPGIILANDRERVLNAVGKMGIIIPNKPDVIERVLLTYLRQDGTTDTKEYALAELMATQADVNPNIATLNYTSSDPDERGTIFMASDTADLFLVDFAEGIAKVQIDTVMGKELRYSLVSLESRP